MKYRINLLPTKELTALDRVIFFSFNYLRYILVITQLVVICVFLFRFNVDQEIVDAKDTLQQKLEIIKVSKPLLDEGERLYKRSDNITQILSDQNSQVTMLNYVLQIFPTDLYLTDLEINKNSALLKGVTTNVDAIKEFNQRIQSDKKFGDAELLFITKAPDGFEFSFRLNNFL